MSESDEPHYGENGSGRLVNTGLYESILNPVCNMCNIEMETDDAYLLLGYGDGTFTLCQPCHNRLKDKSSLMVIDGKSGLSCDICKEDIDIGWSPFPKDRICERIDICKDCLGDKALSAFIRLTPENIKKLVVTDRDVIYLAADPDPDTFEIPESLKDRITDTYESFIDGLVKAPTCEANIAEWAQFTPFSQIPQYAADFALAVRCIRGNHQVASVVEDDHGRYAMDIVYDNVDDFLADEAKFIAGLEDTDARKAAIAEVAEAFKAHRGCDNELIMKATDSFAVYLRLDRNLSTYYG